MVLCFIKTTTKNKYLEKYDPLRPAKIIFLNKKEIYFICEK